MTGVILTNLSSGSEDSLPPRTSIEAIIHPETAVTSADGPTDPRFSTIKNWTTVTTDSDLLAALMSTWTVYDYSVYHYLEKDAFLDDMANGRTRFCSPLLVNALLASACVSYTLASSSPCHIFVAVTTY